jgi:hypothetical protein
MLVYKNLKRFLFCDINTFKKRGISAIIYYIKGNLLQDSINKLLYLLRIKVKLIIFLSKALKDAKIRY